MKKLVVEIPLEDNNDLEETDIETFLNEANCTTGDYSPSIGLIVGRSISEEESHIVRQFEIGAEYFTVRVDEVPDNIPTRIAEQFTEVHPLGPELEKLIAEFIPEPKVGKTRFLTALLSLYDVKKKEA